MDLLTRIQNAADFLKSQTDLRPAIGMILGSGLGDFADTLDNRLSIPFSQIPDFPKTSVEGHTGAFVFGTHQGKAVVILQGRLHFYEGHSMQTLTIPVRVMALLGVKKLVLTNAAGGVNTTFVPGDLMLLTDHINFSGSNPLIGPNLSSFGPRFPDASNVYDRTLRAAILEKVAERDIPLRQGIYMMYSGPNFETPAEIRAFRILGADAIGMSTVPEALVAAHCGIRTVGISCITNMAAGILDQPLNHQEVMETAARVHDKFHSLVSLILEIL